MAMIRETRLLRARRVGFSVLAAFFLATPVFSTDVFTSTPTVRDAIEMVRIQQSATADGRIGAFSPNGQLFAFVTWEGNLDKNLNVYSLRVLDLRASLGERPRTILTREFAGDPNDQNASPFEKIVFLNALTLAYLGRESGGLQQVYSVDIQTRSVIRLSSQASDIRAFIADANSRLRLFSVAAQSDADQVRSVRLGNDGVLLSEESLLGPRNGLKIASVIGPDRRSVQKYFISGHSNDPRLVYDSRQTRNPAFDETQLRYWGTLTPDRQRRVALLFPYALAEPKTHASRIVSDSSKLAAPYGLVDLTTGRIERLFSPLHIPGGSASGSEPPAWAPDGRSVLVFVATPAEAGGMSQPTPQWVEVDLATRRYMPLNAPTGWKVMGWTRLGDGAVLRSDNHFAVLKRIAGRWGSLTDLGTFDDINWRWTPTTDGTRILGVVESAQSPPELMSIDLETNQTRVLTALNRNLRHRAYGSVEEFRWAHKYDDQASGLLVKPKDFDASKRYPLVVLLDDSNLKRIKQPYLLDGFMQLSGHAIQPLVAEQVVVLYTRDPRDFLQPNECARMQEHIHAAIEKLDRDGSIDPNRVGLSGWSRAGYHTDCILMDSRSRFAAATQIDGGGAEYVPKARPYTDEELKRIRTPLLMEAHGFRSLAVLGAMADRLEAFDRPTDVLYFQSAPHSVVRPQHRSRSLETHLDWWRFWLKDEESLDPAKSEQMRQWGLMRKQWAKIDAHRLTE